MTVESIVQKHFIAQNQSRIINCKRCLYLYPDIYPSPFSREYHTGKYWFLNKSKSSNLLIINPAEIAQLVSLERRSLFRPWSSNPCQGWGREFESRFPLQKEIAFGWSLFFVKRTFARTRTRDAPRGSCRRSRLRGLRERQTQASLRSSLVFRSGFSLTSVGLFPYISVSYAALAWLCRRSGLFLTLQRNFRKSGEKRVISGECFTLCLTLENNICKVKLNLII